MSVGELPTPGFNLPHGVSPNDPHIVGYPTCAECGHDAEAHPYDDEIHGSPCDEPGCDCREYDQHGEAPEPEDPREDRWRELAE